MSLELVCSGSKTPRVYRRLQHYGQLRLRLWCQFYIIKCHLLYSFLGVQNLLKKQEAVDAEITAHEQLINAVISTAEQLLERDHYAADEIEARCAKLQDSWAELTSLSAARQQKLQDSLKAQQV